MGGTGFGASVVEVVLVVVVGASVVGLGVVGAGVVVLVVSGANVVVVVELFGTVIVTGASVVTRPRSPRPVQLVYIQFGEP